MSKLLDRIINTPKSIVAGLKVTMANMVRPKLTQKYPDTMPTPMGQDQAIYSDPGEPDSPFSQAYEIAPRYRGLHGLTKDESGDLNCIGCMACANVCPDDLISMDLEKREGHSGRYPVTFTVNIGPCCFCGLCAEVCPTPMRAIVMTDLFEWATYERFGANLVLTQEDLIRNGDYEVARRRAGRQWDAEGELIGVNPEEEGSPYFQFAPESGKADRMAKKVEKAVKESVTHGEPDETRERSAGAASPAAAEPMEQVREAFRAAGLEAPADIHAFDLESLDAQVEDRKLRGQLKSAIMKARRAGEQGQPLVDTRAATPSPAVAPPTAPEPQSDLLSLVNELFTAAGLPIPGDLQAFDLESLDTAIEDRKLRGQLKSAVMRARKAGATTTAAPDQTGTRQRAAPEGAAPAEPAAAPATAPASHNEALLQAANDAFAAVGRELPDSLAEFDLETLDSIEDRKLRGQLKSAIVKAQRAGVTATGAAPAVPAAEQTKNVPVGELPLVEQALPVVEAQAEPAPAAAEPAAPPPATPEAGAGGEVEALRSRVRELLEGTPVQVNGAPEGLELEDLDVIDDRKLRGQAKSALRKLQKALGLVE